jgi:hypothetical protein
MNMRPLVVQARVAQAQSLSALGQSDGVEAALLEAWAMVGDIASLISDQIQREAYLASARERVKVRPDSPVVREAAADTRKAL